MKKIGTFNSPLSTAIAEMGHRDEMTVCDPGFPIPTGPKKVDLALCRNIPRFLDVLKILSEELAVEKVIAAAEAPAVSPQVLEWVRQCFPGVEIAFIPHWDLHRRSANTKCVVRTGEITPYANVILVSGAKGVFY